MNDTTDWQNQRKQLIIQLYQVPSVEHPIYNPDGVICISLAKPEEALTVHSIMHEAFAEYLNKLRPPSSASTANVEDVQHNMKEGGAILGKVDQQNVASAQFRIREDHLYIGRLAVLPEYRGRKIGSALIDYLEMLARIASRRQLRLGTRLSLHKNVALYQRHGFQVEAVARSNGPDSVVWMVKQIT